MPLNLRSLFIIKAALGLLGILDRLHGTDAGFRKHLAELQLATRQAAKDK